MCFGKVSQKQGQRERPCAFGWEAKKYKIIALIGFWVFFSLMIFKNPKPEEANCPNLGSHKPDLCNQPLINRDLLWL